jgi:hypothetical protein
VPLHLPRPALALLSLAPAAQDACDPAWLPTFGGEPGVAGHHVAEVFDDGAGPAMITGGVFASAGGVPAGPVNAWDAAKLGP